MSEIRNSDVEFYGNLNRVQLDYAKEQLRRYQSAPPSPDRDRRIRYWAGIVETRTDWAETIRKAAASFGVQIGETPTEHRD